MSHFKRNHSRSAELFLSVTARLHWENAHSVAKSRLTPTLLPLRFYSKWLCWFPVEINSVLHLSKPSSHSATSCPSPDRWHQCTSTPDLGSTPVDREEWACILGQECLKSFIFNFPNICFYCIQELYSISGKQDKDQYTKIQGGNRSCAIFSFFRSPPQNIRNWSSYARSTNISCTWKQVTTTCSQMWLSKMPSQIFCQLSRSVLLGSTVPKSSFWHDLQGLRKWVHAVNQLGSAKLRWFYQPHCPSTPTPSSTWIRTKVQRTCL